MNTLFETIISIIVFVIIISCLPTILGLISLCVIIYFVCLGAKDLFSDGTEQTTASYDRQSQYSEQNENAQKQTMQNEQKTENKTVNTQRSYSNRSYSNYRHSDDEDHYSGYYDDWRDDDVPPDDEIHFNGTGGPFL